MLRRHAFPFKGALEAEVIIKAIHGIRWWRWKCPRLTLRFLYSPEMTYVGTQENRDCAVRVCFSSPEIDSSCFAKRRNVPAGQWPPSHGLSVVLVGHSEKEDPHLVSGRPEEDTALGASHVAGRICETSVDVPFWAFWFWSVPCPPWWFHIWERRGVPRWRAIGAGPHLFEVLDVRQNKLSF